MNVAGKNFHHECEHSSAIPLSTYLLVGPDFKGYKGEHFQSQLASEIERERRCAFVWVRSDTIGSSYQTQLTSLPSCVAAVFDRPTGERKYIVYWIDQRGEVSTVGKEAKIFHGPSPSAYVGEDYFLASALQKESPNQQLNDLKALIDDIYSAQPVLVSNELRQLARITASSKNKTSKDKLDVEEWALRLAQSVSNTDD